MRSARHIVSLVLFGAFVLVLTAQAADPPENVHNGPSYTKNGLLEVPQRFRSWVFVGADLSVRYKSDQAAKDQAGKNDPEDKPPDAFHTVYINPESYEAYLKTGTFPDPTILVMEVFKAEMKDNGGILAGGRYEGKRIELAAAVKDSRRPGGGVPWAYYSFELDGQANPVKPARAFPDAQCYDCHLRHASKDNVWVQFYPALRDPK